MQFEPTSLPGVILIRPDVFRDARGHFFESWQEQKFCAAGLSARFVQDNQSHSTQHTLRGLHYQVVRPQGKLVRVVRGSVFDVAVDIRKSSSTFGRSVGVTLSEENHCMLWIPPGFAHGFLVTGQHALFSYKCTDYYVPGAEFQAPAPAAVETPAEEPLNLRGAFLWWGVFALLILGVHPLWARSLGSKKSKLIAADPGLGSSISLKPSERSLIKAFTAGWALKLFLIVNPGIFIFVFVMLGEIDPPAGAPVIYIGDDVTDEDAFRTVRRFGGLAVLIGDPAEPRDTAADARMFAHRICAPPRPCPTAERAGAGTSVDSPDDEESHVRPVQRHRLHRPCPDRLRRARRGGRRR